MQGRPWLKYTDGLMFCTVCKDDGVTEKDSVFVNGSAVMKLDGIKYHEVSDRHKRAIVNRVAQTTPVHDTVAAKTLMSLRKADHDSLVTKIRNAHAVAKHNLSFRTYSVICKLDEIKGIPIGSQYCSDKAGAEFCESIARSTRSEVVEYMVIRKININHNIIKTNSKIGI